MTNDGTQFAHRAMEETAVISPSTSDQPDPLSRSARPHAAALWLGENFGKTIWVSWDDLGVEPYTFNPMDAVLVPIASCTGYRVTGTVIRCDDDCAYVLIR